MGNIWNFLGRHSCHFLIWFRLLLQPPHAYSPSSALYSNHSELFVIPQVQHAFWYVLVHLLSYPPGIPIFLSMSLCQPPTNLLPPTSLNSSHYVIICHTESGWAFWLAWTKTVQWKWRWVSSKPGIWEAFLLPLLLFTALRYHERKPQPASLRIKDQEERSLASLQPFQLNQLRC